MALVLSILGSLGLRAAVPVAVPETIPGDAEFAAMLTKQNATLKAITARLESGSIDIAEWFDQMAAALLEGHTSAAHMGRMLAEQKAVKADLVDLLQGQAASDKELYYLRGFANDLLAKDPRYWDATFSEWRTDAIAQRQAMYLPKMRGTANYTFIEESKADAEIIWHDSQGPNECEECPQYAELSPYTKATMWTWPGEYGTPCRQNCQCWISINGVVGFKPVIL